MSGFLSLFNGMIEYPLTVYCRAFEYNIINIGYLLCKYSTVSKKVCIAYAMLIWYTTSRFPAWGVRRFDSFSGK